MLSDYQFVSVEGKLFPSRLRLNIDTNGSDPVIAPYPGFPLDPPFRSRFQSRYLDPLSTSLVLSSSSSSSTLTPAAQEILTKTQEAIVALQIKREMLEKMGSGVVSNIKEEEIPGFGQTGLWKLKECLALFPPSISATSEIQRVSQFKSLLLVINPALSFMNAVGWRALERAFSEEEGTGLEAWTKGISEIDRLDGILPLSLETESTGSGEGVVQIGEGIMGWRISTISRISPTTAQLTFHRGNADESTTIEVPCGPHPFLALPLTASASLLLTPRFHHLLTSLLQLHSLKTFDITFVPTSASGSEGLMNSTGSSLLLIETFAKVLGYAFESVHLYKELSGREIWMRRVVNDGSPSASLPQVFATSSTSGEKGTTTWSPSPLIKGAWEGKLIHLEGIDTIGNLVGSLGRLLGEREGELWEGRRLVGLEDGEKLSEGEVSVSFFRPAFLSAAAKLGRCETTFQRYGLIKVFGAHHAE